MVRAVVFYISIFTPRRSLDQLEGLIEKLREYSIEHYTLQKAKHELDFLFFSCCGDYPGAVAVRQSYGAYEKMSSLDLRDWKLGGGQESWKPMDYQDFLNLTDSVHSSGGEYSLFDSLNFRGNTEFSLYSDPGSTSLSPIPVSPRIYSCMICGRKYIRQSRAEACHRGHINAKPFVCTKKCGDINW
jgi:hypothetical protein